MSDRRKLITLFYVLIAVLWIPSVSANCCENFSDNKPVLGEDFALGDLNGDGKINSEDIKEFNRTLEDNSTVCKCQDLNSDGEVDKKDLLDLEKYLNGSIENFRRCPDFLEIEFDKEEYVLEEYISGRVEVRDYFGNPLKVSISLSIFKNEEPIESRVITVDGTEESLGETHSIGNITYVAEMEEKLSCHSLRDNFRFRTVRKNFTFKISDIERNVVSVKNTGEVKQNLKVKGYNRGEMISEKRGEVEPKNTRFFTFERKVTKATVNSTNFEYWDEKSLITDIADIDIERVGDYSIKIENRGEIPLIIIAEVFGRNDTPRHERFRLKPDYSRTFTYNWIVNRGEAKALNTDGKVRDTFTVENFKDNRTEVEEDKKSYDGSPEEQDGLFYFFSNLFVNLKRLKSILFA